MNKPQKLIHISRCVDAHEVHHLDAIDNEGKHWYATMKQQEEPWLTYVQHWVLRTH